MVVRTLIYVSKWIRCGLLLVCLIRASDSSSALSQSFDAYPDDAVSQYNPVGMLLPTSESIDTGINEITKANVVPTSRYRN